MDQANFDSTPTRIMFEIKLLIHVWFMTEEIMKATLQ